MAIQWHVAAFVLSYSSGGCAGLTPDFPRSVFECNSQSSYIEIGDPVNRKQLEPASCLVRAGGKFGRSSNEQNTGSFAAPPGRWRCVTLFHLGAAARRSAVRAFMTGARSDHQGPALVARRRIGLEDKTGSLHCLRFDNDRRLFLLTVRQHRNVWANPIDPPLARMDAPACPAQSAAPANGTDSP